MKKNKMFFHGSMFLTQELVPGFVASGGKLEEYENNLTNESFFVTTQKNFALQMALCKLIEKRFGGYHYITDEKTISADVTILPNNQTMNEFMASSIYLYVIPERSLGMLKRVPNSLSDEFYTDFSVNGLFSVEQFSVYEFLYLTNIKILFAYDEPDSGDDSVTQFIELSAQSTDVVIHTLTE